MLKMRYNNRKANKKQDDFLAEIIFKKGLTWKSMKQSSFTTVRKDS